MRKFFSVCLGLFLSACTMAQAPESWTSAQMYQAVKKLNVLGSVLYVAAHPDDENTRLITYLSKDKLYRTGYLSLTRGDGGQNLIGEEQGIELGLIRTQELLAARRIDGGEQFFSRAYDFGYSKTPEETFTKWDKEKILSDVVWVIRKFQPDVIVTRFPTTGEGGHGHHTASAILANEAFTAAADPNRFPEQIERYGVQAWQAKRILWNTFNFGGNNTTREDQLKIDVGGYNPLLGKSYGEISAESRSQHKSQGFGVPASRGESWEYFKATNGSQPSTELLEGVNANWSRIEGGAVIEKIVDSIAATFDFIHPEKSVNGLVSLYNSLLNTKPNYWRNKKMDEVHMLIEQCSGLFMEATTNEAMATQTDSLRINFSFNNRLGADARLEKIMVAGFDSTIKKVMDKNRNISFSKSFFMDNERKITQPYWLDKKMETGYYNVSNQQKIGQPDADPALQVVIQLRINDVPFNFLKPVKYKFTDPVKGELYQPLAIVPPVLITADASVKISKGNNNFDGNLTLTGKKKGFTTWLAGAGQQQPDKFKIQFAPDTLMFEEKNKNISVNYVIAANRDNEYYFAADANNGRKDVYHVGLKEVKYDHIPWINYFTTATVANKKLDLKIYGKKVGYITGAGDKVPEALEQMGYEVTLLTNKELAKNNLAQFDAIITGVRTYNTHDWMNTYYDKLMKYVNEGGNLIVQYNTSNQIGPVRAKIGPYNFDITRTRVTDENASVNLLKPEHPAFNFPNKIINADFDGWIQERSIYHGRDTDNKFEKLISMADPGEKSDDGSLLVTKYGKGWFTYTGIVFFRELPAGVSGAYRLLANLIALNKKKGF
jgi:LmbE family N-acetylglucosaminyl deacetylase